jgi:hypothetical protein
VLSGSAGMYIIDKHGFGSIQIIFFNYMLKAFNIGFPEAKTAGIISLFE